jgi:hypothetical protein
MRTALAASVASAVIALPSLAAARPITAGVGLGRIQSKVDANASANDTLQVFGRLGLTSRLSGQVEALKIDTGTSATTIRTFTALLVVDLGGIGPEHRLVGTMTAGAGIDRASDPYGYDASGTHMEGGFGLEYRAQNGLVIGADLRIGGRSVDNQYKLQPVVYDGTNRGIIASYPATSLQEGEYRAGRVFAAIRF